MSTPTMRTSARIANPRPLVNSTWRPRVQCIKETAMTDRCFSQTSSCQATKRRREFLNWMKATGKNFKRPLPGSTNYMSAYNFRTGDLRRKRLEDKRSRDNETREDRDARAETEARLQRAAKADGMGGEQSIYEAERAGDLKPFRLNPHFSSNRVLSEELRETLYLEVVEAGKSVREVSTQYEVTMERVAAAVRMKQMERDWLKEGKPLAATYSRHILAMLPQTKPQQPHEEINDLPVHPKTTQQIFMPVAESRVFTREDAGKAFDAKLLAADRRIPHPQLIALAKAELSGMDVSSRDALRVQLEEQEKTKVAQAVAKKISLEESKTKVVAGRRFDFKFKDVSVNKVGKDGRGASGVGWRYGMPHEDRKPGQVKIPTTVG